MKQKAKTQFNINQDGASPQDKMLYKQLSDITQDVGVALQNGISFVDNTNSTIKQFRVNSGVEFTLPLTNGVKTVGAQIIHTDSAVVTSYKTRYLIDGTLAVTVEMTPSVANLIFFMFGAE